MFWTAEAMEKSFANHVLQQSSENKKRLSDELDKEQLRLQNQLEDLQKTEQNIEKDPSLIHEVEKQLKWYKNQSKSAEKWKYEELRLQDKRFSLELTLKDLMKFDACKAQKPRQISKIKKFLTESSGEEE